NEFFFTHFLHSLFSGKDRDLKIQRQRVLYRGLTMKRNLLLFSLMVICSNLIFAMPLDTRKQIKMKVRVKIEHRSANLPSPIQAYVNNSLLEIEFEHPSNDVTILIINSTTGETVYYEKTTSFEKIKFINLDKHYKTTEYTLKVSSPLWVAVGVISIE
ncbi:DUF3244 domain-containing protein, partial [Bacteroides thetaiotaomicron]|uniref:DUF3244 domain-containing protein n=1 Tax=Bacteroides thetaiotaomicron TaxID=818 RepID=UPI002220FF48